MAENLMQKWREYFGVEKLGDISWSHGMNSKKKLETARKVHFIETDVMLNKKGGLICAHPPNTDSDLSLNDLIFSSLKGAAGIKLDFKLPEIVWKALDLLDNYHVNRPVILNADILEANGAGKPSFHPKAFLVICQTYLIYNSYAIVSPGWTTAEGRPYTKENVDEMISLCQRLDNVTFPVRLSLMEESWPELKRLIEKNGWTLSVWSGTDPVTPKQREWLKNNVDLDKAFIDIG